ncbi:hypothetical protein QYE76_053460 [Lolium multiflorum]|uniref:MADS-box domain-containing protein n=1 Tax=Lolium multiflorum TaxID=4521 RepID=A0AAD8SX98_LOLMU|nr:hypothetical protein QYE76_053460 [Lolium multiflorum]
MPRRKVEMRFIQNARARAATYAKRSKGLQKKASELATLCGVPVALVCAPAATGGAGALRLVWESEEGVLERYCAAAIPPETRAQHTHRSYLEAELGKETAKLARARPGALPDWDAALNDMTVDEARGVLETIEAALSAARDKMVALGLPADDRLELEQFAAPADDASDDYAFEPGHLALDMGYDGIQPQTMPCHGGSNDHGSLLEQFVMQPESSLECVGGGGSYYAGAVDETQAPGGYGDNADYRWLDLTMCNAANESSVPVGYYPNFTDGSLAPEQYSAQDFAGGDYVDTLPLEYPMGMDENFAYYPDMDNNYMAHWQGDEFQRSQTGTGQYQWSGPGTHSSGQAFHYLY